jgi:hypothetical protein
MGRSGRLGKEMERQGLHTSIEMSNMQTLK